VTTRIDCDHRRIGQIEQSVGLQCACDLKGAEPKLSAIMLGPPVRCQQP
jgi:hypothetical protein